MKKNVAVFIAAAALSAMTAFAADDPAKAAPKEPPVVAPAAVPAEKPKLELNDEPHSQKKCLKICVQELGDREKCERICDQTPRK